MGSYRDYKGRDLRGVDGIVNNVIAKRKYPDYHTISYLIVEGETDRKLYKTYVNIDVCQIVVANDKSNVKQVVSLLKTEGILGILGIVDADFDVLEGLASSQDILFTDTHDLETMLLQSLALEKLLDNYGSEAKIAKFEDKVKKKVRQVLIEAATHLGYLRWASLKYNLSLTFEGLDFEKFVDKEALTIELSKMIKAIKDKSQKQEIAEHDLREKMELLRKESYDPLHICCGHDLVCMLSFSLRRTIGTHNTKEVEPEGVEKLLRLAYERSFFAKTQLYAAIRLWEQSNAPFIVLSVE